MLELQIRSGLRTALGAAPTNFTTALDSPDSELAQQLVKDAYVFEHLGLVKSLAERDVEQALMDRLQRNRRGQAVRSGRGRFEWPHPPLPQGPMQAESPANAPDRAIPASPGCVYCAREPRPDGGFASRAAIMASIAKLSTSVSPSERAPAAAA